MPRRQRDRSYWSGPNSGRGKQSTIIAALDFETDPFNGPSEPVRPFAAGIYNGTTYHGWWGDDCVSLLLEYIHSLTEPHIFYAHNGGRFDFTFMLNAIESNVFCIGTRIVRAYIRGRGIAGQRKDLHELRDSFSIVPVALSRAGAKSSIDYSKLSKTRRTRHRQEISDYLKQDCVALHEVVTNWRREFGNGLTMASAAMRQLKGVAKKAGMGRAFEQLSEGQDEALRPFYYGGRVQCFERGIIKGDWKIYDINSSYPNVMRSYSHPVSAGYRRGANAISERTDFAIVEADSDGALPKRNLQTGKLDFPRGFDTFYATGHEIRTGMELGLLRVHRVVDSWEAFERSTFTSFIDTYFALRREAQLRGDATYSLFWKLVMNGAYGKFAQNPRQFTDKLIVKPGDDHPGAEWSLSERYELMDVYSKAIDEGKRWKGYLNVGTGASITGAARAELLRGIHASRRVIYCDTDSVVCNEMGPDVAMGPNLGAWKLEVTGHTAAICERKLYAVFGDGHSQSSMDHYGDPTCVKLASKGVRLTAKQVLDVARGLTVRHLPLAPTVRLDGSQIWTPRNIRSPAIQQQLQGIA